MAIPLLGQGIKDSTKVGPPDGQFKINTGNLFSAILFGDTPLGERWSQLRPEAETLFPQLKMKAVSDLHITIIYIGKEWKAENLEVLREAMRIQITETSVLNPEITLFGRNRQVVVAELHGIPEKLQAQILGVKEKLNKAGFKKPEAYDTAFRAHVTLAESRDYQPNEEQARELQAFKEWIIRRLELSTLKLILDPAMTVRLMLAGATRPTPVPEYITVESFLRNYR